MYPKDMVYYFIFMKENLISATEILYLRTIAFESTINNNREVFLFVSHLTYHRVPDTVVLTVK